MPSRSLSGLRRCLSMLCLAFAPLRRPCQSDACRVASKPLPFPSVLASSCLVYAYAFPSYASPPRTSQCSAFAVRSKAVPFLRNASLAMPLLWLAVPCKAIPVLCQPLPRRCEKGREPKPPPHSKAASGASVPLRSSPCRSNPMRVESIAFLSRCPAGRGACPRSHLSRCLAVPSCAVAIQCCSSATPYYAITSLSRPCKAPAVLRLAAASPRTSKCRNPCRCYATGRCHGAAGS